MGRMLRGRSACSLARTTLTQPRVSQQRASFKSNHDMATIKPIESRTVHQIQSGQVIVDLCSVVKELVENSLDAGATSVDVRFKNQGLESIEVQDNGDGISPQNYETLALKHYTSKLSTYSDLTTLQTFGFRGEALSSLCALSKFSVITCMQKDAPKGTKLEFEVSGKLGGTSVIAAQKGTTVSVENLFNNLPVRRRELERNIKREWSRVVAVLGQYACIQTGIKFSVSQQAGKGKKTTLFSTKGNPTTRENIANVFGSKTLAALLPLDLNLELEPTSPPSQRWSTQEDGDKKDIRIVGHISRPASGDGRQLPDKQMFFVNSRPCGLPQVAKAFNEVYKAYNGHQSPFIFANIELDTHLYDVNVSPDKRTILLHDQNRMLENLKEALTELFESQDYTVPISQLPAQKQPAYKQLTINRDSATPSKIPPVQTQSTEGDDAESEDRELSSKREQSKESEDSPRPQNSKPKVGAVSRDSMNKDHAAVSLISNWLGRKAQDRSEVDAETRAPKVPPKIPVGLSKEKLKLIEKLSKESENAEMVADDEGSETPESSSTTGHSTQVPTSFQALQPTDPSVQVQDEQAIENPAEDIEQGDMEQEDLTQEVEVENPIPALRSPSKPPSSIADRFSSTPRSYRPPAEIATITIGDQTTTSSIGTPFSKRARMDASPSTKRKTSWIQGLSNAGPSFGKSLSQRFAVPGTAADTECTEDVEEEEDHLMEAPAEEVVPDEEEELQEDVVDTQMSAATPEDVTMDASMVSQDPAEEAEDETESMNETEKKVREEARVQEMIEEAENTAVVPPQENAMRAKSMIRGGSKKKDSTLNLVRHIDTSASKIGQHLQALGSIMSKYQVSADAKAEDEALDSEKAEEKLSLTITKQDFAKMKIIGQFNLGFILASRASESTAEDGVMTADDMFIIDQHASDEKYNFERLQATTIVQSQRLVYPKTLDLTAMEEEIVIENLAALETNGFIVKVDESGESAVGQRCQLVSLPLSKDTAFSLTDLEELLALLADHPPGTVPRPSKVRKMFAMRACRSSIMIGKTLTHRQMGKVVEHLGELDKPWNCPHGRPTMRHLCGLGVWDELGWKEDCEPQDGFTDWAEYVRQKHEPNAPSNEDEQEEEILEE